jgi:electron transport complex protein RnfG
MVLTLGAITLIASAAVGYVYKLTEEPIAVAKRAKTTAALAAVLPAFEGEPAAETVEEHGAQAIVYTAKSGGEVVGYAVESTTQKGFGGEIKLMTGFTPAGEILKIEVLGHAETPGLGDKIEPKKSDFSVQFQGKTPGKDFKMMVRKDGGDVDAITASTISSRAYIDAVQNAYNALMSVTGGEVPDAATGATSPVVEQTDGSTGATSTADAAEGATTTGSNETTSGQ